MSEDVSRCLELLIGAERLESVTWSSRTQQHTSPPTLRYKERQIVERIPVPAPVTDFGLAVLAMDEENRGCVRRGRLKELLMAGGLDEWEACLEISSGRWGSSTGEWVPVSGNIVCPEKWNSERIGPLLRQEMIPRQELGSLNPKISRHSSLQSSNGPKGLRRLTSASSFLSNSMADVPLGDGGLSREDFDFLFAAEISWTNTEVASLDVEPRLGLMEIVNALGPCFQYDERARLPILTSQELVLTEQLLTASDESKEEEMRKKGWDLKNGFRNFYAKLRWRSWLEGRKVGGDGQLAKRSILKALLAKWNSIGFNSFRRGRRGSRGSGSECSEGEGARFQRVPCSNLASDHIKVRTKKRLTISPPPKAERWIPFWCVKSVISERKEFFLSSAQLHCLLCCLPLPGGPDGMSVEISTVGGLLSGMLAGRLFSSEWLGDRANAGYGGFRDLGGWGYEKWIQGWMSWCKESLSTKKSIDLPRKMDYKLFLGFLKSANFVNPIDFGKVPAVPEEDFGSRGDGKFRFNSYIREVIGFLAQAEVLIDSAGVSVDWNRHGELWGPRVGMLRGTPVYLEIVSHMGDLPRLAIAPEDLLDEEDVTEKFTWSREKVPVMLRSETLQSETLRSKTLRGLNYVC